jgi:hypothetical protein
LRFETNGTAVSIERRNESDDNGDGFAPAVHDRKGPKASKFIEFYKKRAFNGSNPPKPGEEAA